MELESTKSIWRRIGEPIAKYGQTIFTIGSLVFASGTLYADVRSIKSKMEKVEVTELQQVQMTTEIKNLSKSQDKQSEAISKLTDSVNTLGQVVARIEGHEDEKNRRHK